MLRSLQRSMIIWAGRDKKKRERVKPPTPYRKWALVCAHYFWWVEKTVLQSSRMTSGWLKALVGALTNIYVSYVVIHPWGYWKSASAILEHLSTHITIYFQPSIVVVSQCMPLCRSAHTFTHVSWRRLFASDALVLCWQKFTWKSLKITVVNLQMYYTCQTARDNAN